MRNEWMEIFSQEGYRFCKVKPEETGVFYKYYEEGFHLVMFIDGTNGYLPMMGQLQVMQERVQELFYHPVGRLQDFPEGFPVYHVELLTILLTNQSENAKQLCSEGKNIWIYDQDRKQLIIYENQPGDFWGLKNRIEHMDVQQNSRASAPVSGKHSIMQLPFVTGLIALANILVPVFLSNPYSEEGMAALNKLGGSKSQLAYHALNEALKYAKEDIQQPIRKNLSKLKLSGIRGDNTHEFYKALLVDTKPYIFCLTYPDGHGQQALIFTREKENERIQFVAVVIDDYNGIRDCFGFNDISKFECDKIIERFYQDEQVLKITPEALKAILLNAEKLSDKFPYEYICWKNLLADTEPESIDIKAILNKNLSPAEISETDLEKLYSDEFTQHWFMDYGYGDEFNEMIDILNLRLQNKEYKIDFDAIINLYLPKIFYPEELKAWRERLVMCAYLKLLTGKKERAELIYSLYSDENLICEFLKNILRRSVYEYYFALKYDTELNDGKFSLNELDYIIKLIEKRWVKNV